MELQELLDIPHTLIGSRALGINTEESDYDLVIHINDLPRYLLDRVINIDLSLARYFNLLPKHGNGHILRGFTGASGNSKVDIIALESQEDINIIKQSLEDLKQCPYYMLKNKQTRINLFETALKNYGFTEPVQTELDKISY